jgi:NAD(P)-dependent dehydrogenase (short-subunit alcohol dehydrogenase family)
LRGSAAEHRNALVVNTSSISGKIATPMLGVYSALKHAVVGYTYAMNRELGPLGIKSCVLCPSLVDTQLAAYFEDEVPRPEMIRPEDVAEGVRMLLRLSSWCVIPEIQFMRPGLVP